MEKLEISLKQGQKVYFASDFHLGTPNETVSRQRELKIIRWLEAIEEDAAAIFLVGDIFDFWWEYKYVVPRSHVRFLGKIATLVDNGIPVYFFTGNHDLWMRNYLSDELGVQIFHNPIEVLIDDKLLYVGHGDGLGPGDGTYKLLKKFFKSRALQRMFTWIHPGISFWLATSWSKKSRAQNLEKEEPFLHENEWLLQYAQEVETQSHHDYYVFGHRHLPLEMEVNENACYINLGEWLGAYSYAEFKQHGLELKYFEK